jgi:nanoRNase/pAp phosphatase (c-di-AMP/oligoRNAs hydrolase)
MKLSTETFTQLTNSLLDLNQEMRQKLSSMHSFTGQEMKKLEASLKEIEQTVSDCENAFLLVYQHLELLRNELTELRRRATSKG